MVLNIKNVLNKQSIVQLTLLKVILSILAFLIIFTFLYGRKFWDEQSLKFNYNLLLSVSNVQGKIQSQIFFIEELKKNKILTEDQKISKIDSIIHSIIDNYNDNLVGYYDAELDLIIKNQNQNNTDISFNEIHSLIINEFDNLSYNNKIIICNIPIYYNGKLVGYVWACAKNDDYVVSSFYEWSEFLILGLSFSVIIIYSIRRHIKQIELYLEKFCKIIINNENNKEKTLIKLPELKPVLNKITCFTVDLKKMNLELESSKRKIINIMEGISDGFYALDCSWRFTFVNNETQKIICEDKTEALGKKIWEIFPEIKGSLTYDKLQEAMSQDQAIHWEAEGITISDHYYEYHAYPFEEGLTVFFRDITVLKQQQQEFARLERLNLIGQLAAGISHEIRNPLTTVKGFLQLFGARSKYSQDKEYMDLMISEIDRANSIITDFLSLAKANLDNTKSQNINEIINKVFPMLQADAFNNNKEVVVDLTKLPDIMINENEIKQLILNLVRNALEVSPEQGTVIIGTYLQEDKVVLAIKDHGAGIPQDIQEKVGTPFFTTKEMGTGLGLAISIGIAQRHKAVFEFKTGNDGTVFYTIFPTHSCTYPAVV